MPNLRKDCIAAWKIAVVHKGQCPLVREFQKAPSESQNRAEHVQRRNHTPG